MEYRIVELDDPNADPKTATEVRRFDSAYRAMQTWRAGLLRQKDAARRWYLVDPANRILLRPEDVDDIAA